jgi:Rod binding domain-containing protein
MNPITNVMSPNVFDAMGAGSIHAESGRQQIEAVGTEFEGVFLSMMLKEMRNSLENGGFFGEESSDTYGGMFDLFIGKHLAEAKPLGIADLLLEQYDKSNSPAANAQASTPAQRTSFTA